MSRPATFHVGLTPKRVIDGAIELTRESHLMSWSIRDLARQLAVAPSVIYHHVGGKDQLCRGVVERVLDQIELPDSASSWQSWFRTLLLSAGPLVASYPGVAKWMLMHGPTLTPALPILEAGTTVLHRAGFGARTPFAYAALFNNAMLTISLSDDRLQHEDDGPRDHATMMNEFRRMPTASAHVRDLGNEFIRPFAEGGRTASEMRWSYYHFVVGTTIAGVASTLTTPTSGDHAASPDR